MAYSKLLVATDLSDHSDRTIDAAVQLAARDSADLTLVSVIDLDALFPSLPVFLTDDKQRRIREEAHGRVFEALEALRLDKVPASVPSHALVLEAENVPHAICEHARERGFDAIVIGTHGHSGFNAALLGSVAERVLRLSSVPVLVVPVAPE